MRVRLNSIELLNIIGFSLTMCSLANLGKDELDVREQTDTNYVFLDE